MCNDLGLPFLSTIVTLKYQPKNMQAGEGFYKMACEYRPERDGPGRHTTEHGENNFREL
jgi:hypothetical protein